MNFITFVTQTVIAFVAAGSVVNMALVEVVKRLGLNSRYAPAVSMLFGLVIGIFYGGYETMSYNVLAGVLIGLSSSGLYSGVKKTIEG